MRPPAGGGDQHVDVLIIGAGLSGIGMACQLRRRCPDKTFALLEAREVTGGTWDLFRYPGVRSDSDMFTLGYSFAPWPEAKAIADGAAILRYLRQTAREHGVDQHVTFGSRAVRADWSSADARWTVSVERGGTTQEVSCSFLFSATGYYRYESGHTPHLPGVEHFAGQVVHPQHWPADLDTTGARVVVLGSGATAVTLVPALAKTAAHVTMLQRSPSWVISVSSRDALADRLRAALPPRLSHPLVKAKNVALSSALYQLSRRTPRLLGSLLRRGVARQLPAGFDVERHFTPTYAPWDQRLCLVPDGDLFAALRSGRASVVTDRVEEFTATGIRLASGEHLAADVVVTATGLELLLLGGMSVTVDGAAVDLASTVAYKGMMLSGLPNFALAIGYTNASWTLKIDLVAENVCRLLKALDARGDAVVVPSAPAGGGRRPLLDLQAGYVLRSAATLPRQGDRGPWRSSQDYLRDVVLLRHRRVDDEGLVFSPRHGTGRT